MPLVFTIKSIGERLVNSTVASFRGFPRGAYAWFG